MPVQCTEQYGTTELKPAPRPTSTPIPQPMSAPQPRSTSSSQPRSPPTAMEAVQITRRFQHDIANIMSGKGIQLLENGTVNVPITFMDMFNDVDCLRGNVELLHLAGSISRTLNYSSDELSRFVAKTTLPRLQQLASERIRTIPITKAYCVQIFRSIELVTYLCRKVTIKTQRGIYTGTLTGARNIFSNLERGYQLRVSGDDEWDIYVNFEELAEGLVTISLLAPPKTLPDTPPPKTLPDTPHPGPPC
ncbi:hypothetical protein IG631_01494 [Alternaria alternata]|nr:hypothetical protein IG631_01494 [Alternaria alternata]